jgi:hypothetical protein
MQAMAKVLALVVLVALPAVRRCAEVMQCEAVGPCTASMAPDFVWAPRDAPLLSGDEKVDCMLCGLPPIYWINLARSKDRHDRMLQRLEGVIEHTKVDAVSPATMVKLLSPSTLTSLRVSNTEGEIASALSQIKAVAMAYDAGHEMALVLEDDVTDELIPLWVHPLETITSALPSDWALLQLHLITGDKMWEGMRQEWEHNGAPIAFKQTSVHWGAAAYLIHRRGMKKLLDVFRNDEPDAEFPFKVPEIPNIEREYADFRGDVGVLYKFVSPAFVATPPLFTEEDTGTNMTTHTEMRDYENSIIRDKRVSRQQTIDWMAQSKELRSIPAVAKSASCNLLDMSVVSFECVPAQYSRKPPTSRTEGVLTLVPTTSPFGCDPYTVERKAPVMLVSRGECSFADKARHAEAVGAQALVIVDRPDQPLVPPDLGDMDVRIPVVMVTAEQGHQLSEAIAEEEEGGVAAAIQLVI